MGAELDPAGEGHTAPACAAQRRAARLLSLEAGRHSQWKTENQLKPLSSECLGLSMCLLDGGHGGTVTVDSVLLKPG